MTPVAVARGLRLDGRLHPADLTVGPGEMIALIGPNGGGKTSLLRALADVDGSADQIEIDGEDLRSAAPARRPALLTYQPSSRQLVWPIRVRAALELGLPRPDPHRVDQLIQMLELEGLSDRPADSLSTGERARLLFGRALLPSPRLLLLDEPLSNLDPYWVLRIVELVRDFVGDGERSALLSLHDLGQVETFDRVLLIDHGKVLLDATPAEVLGSKLFSRHFRLESRDGRLQISRPAGPRSSP